MPMPITIVNNNNQQLLCALYCTCLIDCQFLFLRGGGGLWFGSSGNSLVKTMRGLWTLSSKMYLNRGNAIDQTVS